MTQDDLKQRDLSNLSVEQMSAAERAELRRRYEAFVRVMGWAPEVPSRAAVNPRRARRWVPGAPRR